MHSTHALAVRAKEGTGILVRQIQRTGSWEVVLGYVQDGTTGMGGAYLSVKSCCCKRGPKRTAAPFSKRGRSVPYPYAATVRQ